MSSLVYMYSADKEMKKFSLLWGKKPAVNILFCRETMRKRQNSTKFCVVSLKKKIIIYHRSCR